MDSLRTHGKRKRRSAFSAYGCDEKQMLVDVRQLRLNKRTYPFPNPSNTMIAFLEASRHRGIEAPILTSLHSSCSRKLNFFPSTSTSNSFISSSTHVPTLHHNHNHSRLSSRCFSSFDTSKVSGTGTYSTQALYPSSVEDLYTSKIESQQSIEPRPTEPLHTTHDQDSFETCESNLLNDKSYQSNPGRLPGLRIGVSNMNEHTNEPGSAAKGCANIHKTLPRLPKLIYAEQHASKDSFRPTTVVHTPSRVRMGFDGEEAMPFSTQSPMSAHDSSSQQVELADEQDHCDPCSATTASDNSLVSGPEEASEFSFSGMPTEEESFPLRSPIKTHGSKKRGSVLSIPRRSSRRMNRERSNKSHKLRIFSPLKRLARTTKTAVESLRAGPEFAQGDRLVTRGMSEAHHAVNQGPQEIANREQSNSAATSGAGPCHITLGVTSRNQTSTAVPPSHRPDDSEEDPNTEDRDPILPPIEMAPPAPQLTATLLQEKVDNVVAAIATLALEREQEREQLQREDENNVQERPQIEREEEENVSAVASKAKRALRRMMEAFHFRKSKDKRKKKLRISAPIPQGFVTNEGPATRQELSSSVDRPNVLNATLPVNEGSHILPSGEHVLFGLEEAQSLLDSEQNQVEESRKEHVEKDEAEVTQDDIDVAWEEEAQKEESSSNVVHKETPIKYQKPRLIPRKPVGSGISPSRTSQLTEGEDLSFASTAALTSSPLAESTPTRFRAEESNTSPSMPTRRAPPIPVLVDRPSPPITPAMTSRYALAPQRRYDFDDFYNDDEEEDEYDASFFKKHPSPSTQQLERFSSSLRTIPRQAENNSRGFFDDMRARDASFRNRSQNGAVHRRYEIFGGPLAGAEENDPDDFEYDL